MMKLKYHKMRIAIIALISSSSLYIAKSINPPRQRIDPSNRWLEHAINGDGVFYSHRNVCSYLTPAECESIRVPFNQQALRTRAISRPSNNLRQNDSSPYQTLDIGGGVLTTLVVLIQWTNHENRTLIPRDDLDLLWNGVGRDNGTILPSGSIRDYISVNSYGQLQLKAHVLDWQMTNGTESYYANGHSGLPQSTASGGNQPIYDKPSPTF